MLTFINSIINLIYQRLPSTKHFFKQKTTNSSSPHHQQHIHQSSHFHLKYHRHQSTLSLSLSHPEQVNETNLPVIYLKTCFHLNRHINCWPKLFFSLPIY